MAIEVEVRGRLGNFGETIEKFKRKCKFLGEKNRFSLIYHGDKFVEDVSNYTDEKVDLRLRVTNKSAEIILKYGVWGGSDSRKEVSLPISLDKFDNAVELFSLLGYKTGIINTTKTFVFDYNGIEFALVNHPYVNYFEAEKVVKEYSDSERIMKEIKKACRELGLKIMSDKENIKIINEINNAPGAKFDFKKQNFEDIKKRFKEYFY